MLCKAIVLMSVAEHGDHVAGRTRRRLGVSKVGKSTSRNPQTWAATHKDWLKSDSVLVASLLVVGVDVGVFIMEQNMSLAQESKKVQDGPGEKWPWFRAALCSTRRISNQQQCVWATKWKLLHFCSPNLTWETLLWPSQEGNILGKYGSAIGKMTYYKAITKELQNLGVADRQVFPKFYLLVSTLHQ